MAPFSALDPISYQEAESKGSISTILLRIVSDRLAGPASRFAHKNLSVPPLIAVVCFILLIGR